MEQPYNVTLREAKDRLKGKSDQELQDLYKSLKRISQPQLSGEVVCGLILDEMASRVVDEFNQDGPRKPEGCPQRLWDRYVIYFDCVDDPVDFDTWASR